jgi:hypothetical protein
MLSGDDGFSLDGPLDLTDADFCDFLCGMLDADAVDPDFDAMAKMSEMGDDDGAGSISSAGSSKLSGSRRGRAASSTAAGTAADGVAAAPAAKKRVAPLPRSRVPSYDTLDTASVGSSTRRGNPSTTAAAAGVGGASTAAPGTVDVVLDTPECQKLALLPARLIRAMNAGNQTLIRQLVVAYFTDDCLLKTVLMERSQVDSLARPLSRPLARPLSRPLARLLSRPLSMLMERSQVELTRPYTSLFADALPHT